MPKITNEINELKKEYDEARNNPDVFYAADFLKRGGSVIDTDGERKTISNVIVSWMEKDNPLLKVSPVKTSLSYIINHSGKQTGKTQISNRFEELTAMALFKRRNYENSDIDYVVDYQVPIERSKNKTKGIGKIDLVAVSHRKKKIYLMELKRHSNVQESLLRCVAESYTYYRQIDKGELAKQVASSEKLKVDMKKSNDDICLTSVQTYEVLPAVMVFENQRQHNQYMSKHFNKVRTLMKDLNVSMFVIKAPKDYRDKNFAEIIPTSEILDITG